MHSKRLTPWTGSNKALLAGALSLTLACGIVAAADEKAKPAPTPAATVKPAALTPQQKKEQDTARVLEFLQKFQPDVFEKAVKLRDTEPEKFEQLIAPVIGTVNYLESLKKNHPDLYALKVEDYSLTFQIEEKRKVLRRTDLAVAEHDKLVGQLEKLVTRQFEVGQQMRRYDLAQVQARLAKLQADLDDREKNKDSIIKQRLKDMGLPTTPVATPTAQKK